MPNQLNFPEPVVLNTPPNSSADLIERPDRIEIKDLNLISKSSKNAIFGTSNKDVIEVHLYDLNNIYIQTQYIYPTDDSLTLTTIVDEVNAQYMDYLNIDMKSALESMGVIPGRYLTAINFFRNEIGSDFGERLYISEISPLRTEVKLEAIDITDTIMKEIYEFIVPAVPRIIAQGLVDQLYSQSIDFTQEESIQSIDVNSELSTSYVSTSNKLNYAGLADIFSEFVDLSMKYIREMVLEEISKTPSDFRIQQSELDAYILIGIEKALRQMVQMGLLDNRMELI